LWGFLIWGLEGGIGPPTCGGPHNSTGPRFQITKHLNLAIWAQRAKFFRGSFEIEVLKVELAPQRMGVLIVPPGPQFQITKYLNLIVLFQRAKFFRGCFEFEVLKVELDPKCAGTS
jgi:hypothetical protein